MSIKSSQKLVEEANEIIETLSPEEIKSLIDKNEITLIDVRDIRELWRDGTIENSKHIPRGMIEFWLDPDSSYYNSNKIKDINPDIKIFMGKYTPKNYSKLKKMKFIVFSGIGNPHTFLDTLKSLIIKVYGYEQFPDHYDYEESDLQKLKNLGKGWVLGETLISGIAIFQTKNDKEQFLNEWSSKINSLGSCINAFAIISLLLYPPESVRA